MLKYDSEYFKWQNSIGQFGGKANLFKFSDYISSMDSVLDFGCGGGWLLKNINCRSKVGIEINDVARTFCREINNITSYKFLSEVESNTINVAISNHALEHVDNPLEILKEILEKLVPGGKAIFVVPSESVFNKYSPNDINMHLYSWNPQTIGNLFTKAGFNVLDIKPIWHKWIPCYIQISSLSWGLFDTLSRIYSVLNCNYSQIRIVAQKPTN